MNPPQKSRSEWFSPQLIYMAGVTLFGMYGGYVGFQKDSSAELARLEYRLEASEKAIQRADTRQDAADKVWIETNIRLDRLEHKK